MRILRNIIIGIIICGLLITAYFYFNISEKIGEKFGKHGASKTQTLKTRQDYEVDFDLSIDLPGDSLGIASNNSELVLCNRADDLGFLRLKKADSKTYEAEEVPVLENTTKHNMGFITVTWNGKSYVSYMDATYLISGQRNIFAIHDPKTMALVSHYKAPDFIGGLAWDGKGYWAATRRSAINSTEPSYLYHLDNNFNVISKTDPPDAGCQGLTWDGINLWFADAFSHKIYVLDVSGDKPQVIHTYESPFKQLGGIGFDGENIWVSEMDNHRIHRLKQTLMASWTGRETEPKKGQSAAEQSAEQQSAAAQAGLPTQETNQINESTTSATYKNTSVEVGDEGMEVLKLTVEIRGDILYGSWRIYCGENLFKNNSSEGSAQANVVRYTVKVEGENLDEPKQIDYNAERGENVESDTELLQNMAPGRYAVSILLHAEYTNSEGEERTINSSSPAVEVTKE